MKTCLLCSQPTTGSIGAAGLVWDSICQPCKDFEDSSLAFQVKTEARGFKFVCDKLFGLGELGSEVHVGQGEVDSLRKEEKMEQFV